METPKDSTSQEVSEAIDLVASKSIEWANLPAAEKRALFVECLAILEVEGVSLARAASQARGYNFDAREQGHLVADAYNLSLTTNAAWIRGGIFFFEEIERTGHPPAGTTTVQRPDGSTRVTVFPNGLKEALIGDTGWWTAVPIGDGGRFELSVRGNVKQVSPLSGPPAVTGVLGAGNTEICNDIVDPLCKGNSVVVYKSNPVMIFGAEVKRRLFAPLIARGYLAILHGGIGQGMQIVDSEKIDRMIMTGSHHTFDRIQWGQCDKSDPAQEPTFTKPFTSELGSVNPYIVLPGDAAWSRRDLNYQAEILVAYKMVNNAHICAAPQVVVTCRQWPQREEFLEAVRAKVRSAPAFRCFYPGVGTAYEAFRETMRRRGDFCEQAPGPVFGVEQTPLLFQTDVLGHDDVEVTSILGLESEAFCPILLEVALDTAAEASVFLRAAVDFCHAKCWGSLTCSIVVDDATRARHTEALEAAIDSMKFGCVGVNAPPSVANAFPLLSWGAFPGHTVRDIQSGMGHVGNFGCYENVEKSILHARFRNLLQFKLDRSPSFARKRAERLSDVFTYYSYWRVLKFASVEFLGI